MPTPRTTSQDLSLARQSVPPPALSVVAPCYNEASGLEEFYRRTSAACAALGLPYEIVLVNDGSADETWPRMNALAQKNANVVCVNLSRNHGHQLALTAGLHVCAGQRILIIDADLQDPPELLPAMMELMDRGTDVVYGRRRKRKGEGFFKRVTASLFYWLVEHLTDTPIPRDTGDFRLLSRRALDILMQMPERHRFIRGMVSWIGFVQQPLLYDRDPRFAGKTKYTIPKMFKFAFDAITAFSIKPLRIASFFGLFSGIASLGLFFYSLYSWLFLGAITGWTSLMAAMAMLSAVQLFALGIFGEYLGRLYDQSKGRPLFIIESIVHGTSDCPPAPPQSASVTPSKNS